MDFNTGVTYIRKVFENDEEEKKKQNRTPIRVPRVLIPIGSTIISFHRPRQTKPLRAQKKQYNRKYK